MSVKQDEAANLIEHWDFRTGNFEGTQNATTSTPDTGLYWGNSDRGKVINFSGINEIALASSVPFQVDTFTIMGWIKPISATSTQPIFAISGGHYYLAVSTNHSLLSSFFDATPAQQTNFSNNNIIVDGEWQLIGLTISTSGSNVTLRFYVNGVFDKEVVETTGWSNNYGATGFLGAFAANSLNFQGPIREIYHYGAAFTDQQMTDFHAESVQEGYIGGLPKRHFRGPELMTHPDFERDAVWTKGTGWTIAGGKASCDGTQVADSDITQTEGTVGKTYTVKYSISGYSAGNITGLAGTAEGTDRAANGVFYDVIVAAGNTNLGLRADSSFVGDVDFVEITEGTRLIYRNDFSDYPVTIGSALGAGNPFTDGTIQTGTWKVGNDSTGRHLLNVTDGQLKIPLVGASGFTTDTFEISGTPTLTKNANDLQVDAVAGEKIYSIILTP